MFVTVNNEPRFVGCVPAMYSSRSPMPSPSLSFAAALVRLAKFAHSQSSPIPLPFQSKGTTIVVLLVTTLFVAPFWSLPTNTSAFVVFAKFVGRAVHAKFAPSNVAPAGNAVFVMMTVSPSESVAVTTKFVVEPIGTVCGPGTFSTGAWFTGISSTFRYWTNSPSLVTTLVVPPLSAT